jgi:hypothetical protein
MKLKNKANFSVVLKTRRGATPGKNLGAVIRRTHEWASRCENVVFVKIGDVCMDISHSGYLLKYTHELTMFPCIC